MANDVILRLVEMLMAEKDKNTKFQLMVQQQKQEQDKQSNEDI